MIVDLKISTNSETGELEWAYKRAKPLSKEQIESISLPFHDVEYDYDENPYDIFDYEGFAKAIEEAHGIK